jgi:aryl-alcohol dehydrogenase-like predicted oxidoreductase
MRRHRLGSSDIEVSALCLGTMTWGEQNSAAEAHAQIDRALAAGINFIDTAELYPAPARAATQGRTEACIGDWLAARGHRDRVVLATKVCGRADWFDHIRGGATRLDRAHITAALDASLQRLRTDYVDLLQCPVMGLMADSEPLCRFLARRDSEGMAGPVELSQRSQGPAEWLPAGAAQGRSCGVAAPHRRPLRFRDGALPDRPWATLNPP